MCFTLDVYQWSCRRRRPLHFLLSPFSSIAQINYQSHPATFISCNHPSVWPGLVVFATVSSARSHFSSGYRKTATPYYTVLDKTPALRKDTWWQSGFIALPKRVCPEDHCWLKGHLVFLFVYKIIQLKWYRKNSLNVLDNKYKFGEFFFFFHFCLLSGK